ncbi:MAG: hypothetical protein H7Z39_19275 [Burkholderiaceae bacterium]|nr:hypothetical protein [Burkholderiaceae bacterium]
MNLKPSLQLAVLAAAMSGAGAHAEVVVIVSSKSTLAPSVEQVCQSFLGKIKNPVPITLNEKNATRDEFYSKSCNKDPAQVRSIWAKLIFTGGGTPPKEVENDKDMKKLVAADPQSIGYIDKKNLDASVKMIGAGN